MNSNYEWQKHQAKERLQARLKEAEAHRLVKTGCNDRPQLARRMIARVISSWPVLKRFLRKGGLRTSPADSKLKKRSV